MKILNHYTKAGKAHGSSAGAGGDLVGMLDVFESDFTKTAAEQMAADMCEKDAKEAAVAQTTREQDIKYKTKASRISTSPRSRWCKTRIPELHSMCVVTIVSFHSACEIKHVASFLHPSIFTMPKAMKVTKTMKKAKKAAAAPAPAMKSMKAMK